MIHREATIRYAGYDPDELGQHSHKRVCCVCESCGRVRWLAKGDYSDNCKKCAQRLEGDRRILVGSLKGNKNPMFGRNHTEEAKEKDRTAHIGRKATLETRKKMSEARMGDKNPMWKGGIYHDDKAAFYASVGYKHWRESIIDRDNNICQECGNTTDKKHAHHILPWRDYPEIKYSLNIDNGITLCVKCHRQTYGKEYDFVGEYLGKNLYGDNSKKND